MKTSAMLVGNKGRMLMIPQRYVVRAYGPRWLVIRVESKCIVSSWKERREAEQTCADLNRFAA